MYHVCWWWLWIQSATGPDTFGLVWGYAPWTGWWDNPRYCRADQTIAAYLEGEGSPERQRDTGSPSPEIRKLPLGCQDPNVITVAQLRDVARDNGVRFHKKDRRAEMVQIVSHGGGGGLNPQQGPTGSGPSGAMPLTYWWDNSRKCHGQTIHTNLAGVEALRGSMTSECLTQLRLQVADRNEQLKAAEMAILALKDEKRQMTVKSTTYSWQLVRLESSTPAAGNLRSINQQPGVQK
ncbi:hypothetical protein BZA05DRAFT_439739 [Tricharina praecox]|uniref:uncharacterized protein n=1 Tax=Tricharina praecox TaxID=43433 RepID=UPI00222089EA|nr:uncharacterized protein BZA05DRAFT_439739 [Tricharina praecox]KAI5841616.1 hypothetical protein BZA05DRAFT_439739 [Tricharina praecox]